MIDLIFYTTILCAHFFFLNILKKMLRPYRKEMNKRKKMFKQGSHFIHVSLFKDKSDHSLSIFFCSPWLRNIIMKVDKEFLFFFFVSILVVFPFHTHYFYFILWCITAVLLYVFHFKRKSTLFSLWILHVCVSVCESASSRTCIYKIMDAGWYINYTSMWTYGAIHYTTELLFFSLV